MSTGDERSPISLDSDSETSQDVHPVDAVIQQAIYRNRTPTHSPRSNVNVKSGKRKRDPTPPDADVISLHSSSSDEASHDSDREQAENKTSIASGAAKPALVAPIGVTVVEEGAQTRNPEVQRLLRGGRQVFYLQHAVLKAPQQRSAFCSHVIKHRHRQQLLRQVTASLQQTALQQTAFRQREALNFAQVPIHACNNMWCTADAYHHVAGPDSSMLGYCLSQPCAGTLMRMCKSWVQYAFIVG